MKEFFLNLYEKFIHLSWVEWTIDFCKNNLVMAGIIGGTILFILVILCIMGGVSRKAKKAAKRAAKTPIEQPAEPAAKIVETPVIQTQPAEVVEEVIEEPVEEIIEEVVEEPVEEIIEEVVEEPVEEVVEEVVEEPIEEIVEEVVEEPIEEIVEEVVEEPVEEIIEEVVEEPVEEIIEEVVEEVVEEPVEEIVEEVVEEPVEEIIEEVVEEPIEEIVEEVVEEPVEEVVEEPIEEIVEEVIEEPIEEIVEEVVEEPVEEIIEEVVEEVVEEPVEEIVEEVVEEPVEKTVKVVQEIKPVTEIGETIALIEKMDDSVPEFLRDHYEEGEMDKIARYTGKWSICRVLTDASGIEEMYFFELRASNGEKLLSSEEYTTYQGALRGIQTHKSNILNGNIKMSVTKKGDYIFKVLSGKNMLLCLGQNYPTMARCQKAINSTKRFAETAILDENVQDIVVKVPMEENVPAPTFPEGSVGKWIIFDRVLSDSTLYFFELFANNGERLLSSESYTTYIGAINGIQTYKSNIQRDNFRISLTKRGDYIYKLLNANGQLLCLGEHYKTKRLCENAVESVKRFALTSPVLTEEKK